MKCWMLRAGGHWTGRLAVLVAGGLLVPSLASATVPSVSLTLDSPVNYSITGSSGTFEPYEFATDGILDYDNDSICLDDDCSIAGKEWLIFRVNVLSGTLDETALGPIFASAIGLGYFQGGIGSAPVSGEVTADPTSPEWQFSSLTGQSTLLFAVYDGGTLPTAGGPLGLGGAFLRARVGGSENQFAGNLTTPVPEPSTALLMALGLTCLARFSRESGRRD